MAEGSNEKFTFYFRCSLEADSLCVQGSIGDEYGTFEFEFNEVSHAENNLNASGNLYERELSGPANAEEENVLDKMAEAIVKCIFESLDIIQETGASLNTFQDLLVFARHMYCRGRGLEDEDESIKAVWPRDWETAKHYLVKLGYQDAKEYFICLDESHKRHWDIMDKKTDTCRHCGQPGKLKYYYLGLKGKVKQWASSPEMCRKMTGHWREKEHWLGRERGWPIKREIWDGDRFCELSWFWDPNAVWCLPARCKTKNCCNVISGKTIESLPESPAAEGLKEVFCQHCHSKFLHEPKYTRGDPRNLAFIGKIYVQSPVLVVVVVCYCDYIFVYRTCIY